jgi:hypothetical protein
MKTFPKRKVSMALPPTAIVQFPDQQQILNYALAHPGYPILDALPGARQDLTLISKAFANRAMPRGEIEQNIKGHLMTSKKALDFTVSVEKITDQLRQFDGPDPDLELSAQGVIWVGEQGFRAHLDIYKQFLDDLVSKAVFMPPTEDKKHWTREVGLL